MDCLRYQNLKILTINNGASNQFLKKRPMTNSVKGFGCIKEACIYRTVLTSIILNHTFYCINTHISRMLLLKAKLMMVCTNVIFNDGQNA